MFIGLADSEEKAEWNSFVTKHSDSEFLQSWGWGDFQSSYGRRVWRFVVRHNDEMYGLSTAICMQLRRGRHFVYIPRGPIIKKGLTREQRITIWSMFTQQWRLIGLESNAIFVRIEPPHIDVVGKEDRTTRVNNFLIGKEWVPVKRVQPKFTSIVSLKESEEIILSRMHHKTRYNIRLAEKKGLTFRMIKSEKEFQLFWKLHSDAAQRDSFSTYSYEYYRKLFNILLDEDEKPDVKRVALRVFIVEKGDGTPLAAALVITFGTRVVYLFGGSDHQHRNLMAPYLLHWSIIKRGKKNGFEEYDLWGVTPPGEIEEHSWQGFSRFKLGFGGQTFTYPGAYDFPYRRMQYKLYTVLKQLRKKL
jgi:peptidoglycan pentaglycine glycine transferase (the first glycine)